MIRLRVGLINFNGSVWINHLSTPSHIFWRNWSFFPPVRCANPGEVKQITEDIEKEAVEQTEP
jgi:hypothetical protein